MRGVAPWREPRDPDGRAVGTAAEEYIYRRAGRAWCDVIGAVGHRVEQAAAFAADLPEEIERGVFSPSNYVVVGTMLVLLGMTLHAGSLSGAVGAAGIAVLATWFPVKSDRRWRADE